MKSRFHTEEDLNESPVKLPTPKSIEKPSKSIQTKNANSSNLLSPYSHSANKKNVSSHTAVDDEYAFSEVDSCGPSNGSSVYN